MISVFALYVWSIIYFAPVLRNSKWGFYSTCSTNSTYSTKLSNGEHCSWIAVPANEMRRRISNGYPHLAAFWRSAAYESERWTMLTEHCSGECSEHSEPPKSFRRNSFNWEFKTSATETLIIIWRLLISRLLVFCRASLFERFGELERPTLRFCRNSDY